MTGGWRLIVGGRWDVAAESAAGAAWREVLTALSSRPGQDVRLDLAALHGIDTVGALLLRQGQQALAALGHTVPVQGLQPAHAGLVTAVWQADAQEPSPPPPPRTWRDPVIRVGELASGFAADARDLLGFFGLLAISLGRAARDPRRLRLTALVFHIQHTGLNALPILGLLSFLIGVVLAFQGAEQLRRYGADLFVVNLLGISVLREIGILMTAIIVAGRSGSAFTAQIGTMKVNQEVDALRTLGLDPMELLVLPRVLALVLVLPLLGFYADIVSLLGGAVMCRAVLGISFLQFLKQLNSAVGPWTLWVGLVKAPIFALAIAMVGCHEGLRVSGSAESVGRLTTRAVVESIFLVIIIDALFSVLFAILRV